MSGGSTGPQSNWIGDSRDPAAINRAIELRAAEYYDKVRPRRATVKRDDGDGRLRVYIQDGGEEEEKPGNWMLAYGLAYFDSVPDIGATVIVWPFGNATWVWMPFEQKYQGDYNGEPVPIKPI